MQEKLKKLTQYHGVYDTWKQIQSGLIKIDTTFFVVDFDDTLFSRRDILTNEKILRDNRGALGNLLIVNDLGIPEHIGKYYSKNFPQEIYSQLTSDNSLILTAGFYEIQKNKIHNCGLSHLPLLVTLTGQDKIIALIRYILFDLKYIPSKIRVYEDRPEFFIEYRDLITDVLGCELEIMLVEMDGNNGYKGIERV